MNIQEIYEEIQSIRGKGKAILSGDPEVNGKLDRLYQTVYQEQIKRGCRDCSMVAYGKLIRLNQNQIKIMSERKFKLKPGKSIQLKFGSSEMLSNDNLTDAVAIRLLHERPYLVREFAEFPKNEKGELVLPAEKKAATGEGKKVGGKKGKGVPRMENPPPPPKKSSEPDPAADDQGEGGKE